MIEWDQPTKLNAPVGDLLFNQAMTLTDGSTGYFMLDPAQCKARRALRVTSDGIPQGDGRILHRRFSDGIELSLVVELWKRVASSPGIGDGEPACGADLRVMLETLGLYLQAVLNGRGRWQWTPSSYPDDRMLDEARWLVDVARTLDGKRTTVTFGLDSPFPHFIDATQGSSASSAGGPIFVPAGVPTSIFNDGNHPFLPVIQALGGFADFTIENQSLIDQDGNPLTIVYDSARPFPAGESGIVGSSEYAEIDCFQETIYLNGNLQNLKPGIDPEETDYFFLRPGENVILSDVDLEVLANNAWTPA